MPFYKFLLNTGHCGTGKSNELIIYLYANSYTQALKHARNFPAVKHGCSRAVFNSQLIDEKEYVYGVIQNAYRKELDSENIITSLSNIARMFSYIKGYQFVTEEGKTLKGFCDTYSNAKSKVKTLIEHEYEEWARSLLDIQNIEYTL